MINGAEDLEGTDGWNSAVLPLCRGMPSLSNVGVSSLFFLVLGPQETFYFKVDLIEIDPTSYLHLSPAPAKSGTAPPCIHA